MTRQVDYTAITERPGTLLNRAQMERIAQRYALAAELGAGRRVLEVACGAGIGLGYVAQRAQQVVGLDYTASVLVQACGQYGERIPLLQADAQTLPFAGGCFDLLLCFEAIYYLADYRRFLQECRRVLAPGGALLLCQSNPGYPDFVPGRLTTHYPSLPELAQALHAAGFDRCDFYGGLPLQTVSRRQRWANRLRRAALQSGLVDLLAPLTPLFKRLGYGPMTALPAALAAEQVAAWAPNSGPSPITGEQDEPMHRVIYARATVAQEGAILEQAGQGG